MRLDINIQGGPPPGDDSGHQAAQLGTQMGHLLARMEFDYPIQMLAVVKVDNGDGTYDCHRPGTNIYMSRVETISPVLAQAIAVGMTVLIRFFRRDRTKPYIVRVAGGIKPELAEFLIWACSRGNHCGNFMAHTPAAMLDISAVPVRVDPYLDPDLGSGLLIYPVSDSTYMVVHDEPDVLVALPPGVLEPDYWFGEFLSESVALSRVNTWGCLHYVESLNVILHLTRDGLLGTLLIAVDATSGSTPGAAPVTDFSDVTVMERATLDCCLDEGCVVAGTRIVKGFHHHQYTHGASSTTDAIGTNNQCIVGVELTVDGSELTAAVEWTWNPNTLWDGTATIPRWREIVNAATIVRTLNGIPVGGSIVQLDGEVWPSLMGKSLLLPGTAPVYLADAGLVVVPISGRQTINTDTATWSNPTYPSQDSRTRRTTAPYLPGVSGTPHLSVEGSPAGGTAAAGVRLMTLQGVGLGGPGSVTYLHPVIDTTNSIALRAWLVALNVETGTEAWRYALPELLATDSDNYHVDTDSFAKLSTCQRWVDHAAAIVAANTGAGPPVRTCSTSFSGDVVHPDEIALTNYASSGGDTTHEYATGLMGTTLADYLYWPPGALYYWDPMLITHSGENATGSLNQTQGNLVADANERVYGVYLQPKIFISCADLWHQCDQSVADRTHSAVGTWSTIYNGFESDRLTLKPDMVDAYLVIDKVIVSGVSVAYSVKYYGYPHRFTCFRSFLGCWDSTGQLLWTKELSTYHDEMIDDSPGLDGLIPYPGVTMRIIPTSRGVFLLRLERLNIKTTIREAALRPPAETTYSNTPTKNDFVNHAFNSKAVLEFRDLDGILQWKETIYDPTAMAPAWCCASFMLGSETASSGGDPWVTGRVDFSTDYDMKVRFMDSPASYGGLTRVSKMFTCDVDGNLETRDAVHTDPRGCGVWPYDFINTKGHHNGRAQCKANAIDGGVVHYGGTPAGEANSFAIYKLG